MKKVSNGSAARILVIFRKLSRIQKLKVVSKLENETREERWDDLTEKLSRPFRSKPIADEEITRLVEEVRQERYERNQNRS